MKNKGACWIIQIVIGDCLPSKTRYSRKDRWEKEEVDVSMPLREEEDTGI